MTLSALLAQLMPPASGAGRDKLGRVLSVLCDEGLDDLTFAEVRGGDGKAAPAPCGSSPAGREEM